MYISSDALALVSADVFCLRLTKRLIDTRSIVHV